MKKIILSLSALFAVSLASAQSYPKQPDRTIVEYRNYQKPAAEPKEEGEVKEESTEAKEAKADIKPAAKKEENKIQKANTSAILNSNKKGVAVTETTE
jgi:hypothetical protein